MKDERREEITFPELFRRRFPMRRGDLEPVKLASQAETREENSELVDVTLGRGVLVPRLQRDYAQGRKDGAAGRVTRVRREFLDALYRAITGDSGYQSLNFIYGKFDKPNAQAGCYEATLLPLDGQQRLTTLYLLHWYASRRVGRVAEADYLANFSYSTRYSSEAFCKFLCSINSLMPDARERDFLMRKNFPPSADNGLPAGTGVVSAYLANKSSFMDSWRTDPTVAGMLVMLDAIHEKFGAVQELWTTLTGPQRPLRFHFLPLATIGVDADEVFIKMNSRGLELTEFEYFKADLLRLLENHQWSEEDLTNLGAQIDRDWENVFWNLARDCGLDNVQLDPLLMRYSNYVIDMIGFRNRRFGRGMRFTKPNTHHPERYDPDRIREVLVPGGKLDEAAVELFLGAFDCWVDKDGCGGAGAFFDDHFVSPSQASSDHEAEPKIVLFRRKGAGVQLLADCAMGRDFSIPDSALLFAIIAWCGARKGDEHCYPDSTFSAPFRAIRNISTNMDSSAETLYLWLNAFPKIMGGAQITPDFDLDEVERSIPKPLVAEENFKLTLADTDDPRLQELRRLEQHDWLRGRINAFCPEIARGPVDDQADCSERLLDRVARLGEALVHLESELKPEVEPDLRLALLLVVDHGTYTVKTRHGQEFWGTSIGRPADARWRELFRRPNGQDYPGNSEALLGLLEERVADPEGPLSEWLPSFVKERLAAAVEKCAEGDVRGYDLRYYLLRYPGTMLNFPGWPDDPSVRQKAPGGIAVNNGHGNRLAYLVNTFGNWFWDPYLLTILQTIDPDVTLFKEHKWRGSDMAERWLEFCGSAVWVCCREKGFYIRAPEDLPLHIPGLEAVSEEGPNDAWLEDDDTLWLWPVRQHGGLDMEDRIERGLELFRLLKERLSQ